MGEKIDTSSVPPEVKTAETQNVSTKQQGVVTTLVALPLIPLFSHKK